MNVRFTGSYDELKAKLEQIRGEWRELNPNQRQFRTPQGGILNWYPSTGSLSFQGSSPAVDVLRNKVAELLTGVSTTTPAAGITELTPVPAPPKATPPPADLATTAAPVATVLADSRAATFDLLHKPFSESELVLGLIGAVGTELPKVRTILEDWLKNAGYTVTHVRITQDVIPAIARNVPPPGTNECDRLNGLMDAGNEARATSCDNSILALGAAAFINSQRRKDNKCPQHEPKRAFIISSLKHPAEVARLREIYPQGFYLIGVHADERQRFNHLTKDKGIADDKANALMYRDEDEHMPHGQRVSDTFHLSDFFVRIDGQDEHLRHSLWRILELLFGNPYATPTFDEYAMFLAFAASLSSGDLSRQVGAVVAIDEQIVATGANDCPRADGGRYWPIRNPATHQIEDQEDGRDYMRGEDSNKVEQQKIIDDIVNRGVDSGLNGETLRRTLDASRIRDLTEFGRVVHAEMEALLSCARARIATKHGTLYSTTFPCHNCAKHIVAAGIQRVVFVEPYEKSKAAEFHSDSIRVGFPDAPSAGHSRPMVHFEPFVGVGPRRFFDLFSVRLGSGYPLQRKDAAGQKLQWTPKQGRLRLQMLPVSYLDLEFVAADMFNKAQGKKEEGNAG